MLLSLGLITNTLELKLKSELLEAKKLAIWKLKTLVDSKTRVTNLKSFSWSALKIFSTAISLLGKSLVMEKSKICLPSKLMAQK